MSDNHIKLEFEPPARIMLVLLWIFIGIFLAQVLVPPFGKFAIDYLAMDPEAFLGKGRVWQAITSIFLHGDVMHILLNMVFFWIFGNSLANAWRSREFLGYFLMCGLAGSLCFFAYQKICGSPIPGIGASGAIFGLMIAYALVFGEQIVLAFFVIPMKAKYFVAICVGIELLALYAGAEDGIGHMAHLGGAVAGALWLKAAWRWQDRRAGMTFGKAATRNRLAGLEVMDQPQDRRKNK